MGGPSDSPAGVDGGVALREAVERLAGHGVRYVCCSMVDTGGINRVKCVPIHKFERAVRSGIGAPCSWSMSMSNDHFARPDGLGGPSGDLRLKPDPEAVVQLAAAPFWAWAPVDQYTQDGELFALCQRSFLRRMVELAGERGFELRMAYEFEWFAMRPGDAACVPGHDGPGFSSSAWAATRGMTEDLLETLAVQGLDVELFHPEYALGQLEVSVAPLDPLGAADENVLFRHTTRVVSARHGVRPSFAPVRVVGQVGSGCHLHFSLWDTSGRNLFDGLDGRDGLTRVGESFLAGVLSEAGALTGLGCPTVPSYERLRPQRWACAYRVWGLENREAVLRLIPGMVGERAAQANAEFRAVDCAANPYLLAGALIATGLEGVRRGLSLPAGVDGDPHMVEEAERRARGILRLPERLSEAASELAASGTMRHAMGDRLHDAVVEVRRGEAAADEGRPLEALVAEHLWRF
ncbi:MAG: glutamine synthetase family protein [Thermoleophilia bacterium]